MSAVFGRASTGRLSLDLGNKEDSSTLSERKEPRTRAEFKVRLVQLDIAQKEACKVIQSICQEMSALANIPLNDHESSWDDLLPAVLLLGNISKRICYEKIDVQSRWEALKCEFSDFESKKKSDIEQLEGLVSKLQAEARKTGDVAAELTMKHDQKMAIFNKEMTTLNEQFNDLKAENEKMQTKMKMQERKLMEIPRLEEQYLRTAKSIVRQQEVSNTMNKIEFKKYEEEVKTMNAFKAKAKYFEQQVEDLRAEIESLTVQNRTTFSKYQTLQLEFSRYKSRIINKEHKENAMANCLQSSAKFDASALVNTKGNGGSSARSRPTSAPPLRSASTKSMTEGKTPVTVDSNESSQLVAARQLQSPSNKQSATNSKKPMSSNNAMQEEILRLHSEIQLRDRKLQRMAQKLSHVRAFPLRGVEDPDDEWRLEGRTNRGKGIAWESDENPTMSLVNNHQRINSTAPAHVSYLTGDLSQTNYMLDEIESTSSSCFQKENSLFQQRAEHAVKLQMEFDDRFAKHRANLPPHIAAIRNAKSFVKVLEEEDVL